MSEQGPQDTSATEEEITETTEEQPEGSEELGDKGKKALAAERRRATLAEKALKDAQAKLKDIEDADKSETDKLREETATAKRDLEEANRKVLRAEVGAAKELPRDLWNRLQGETQEDMETDADRLLAIIKPGKPSGDAGGGSRGKPPSTEKDMNEVLRDAVSAARR